MTSWFKLAATNRCLTFLLSKWLQCPINYQSIINSCQFRCCNMLKQTHWWRWILHRHVELVYSGGRRVEGLGETAQQVAHLARHVSHGDRLIRVISGSDADHPPPEVAWILDPLGQLAEKEAAGHLLVELAQSLLVLQEIPQIHTVLQQQTHKLRFVANQGWEHGPVEVTGLDGKKPAEQDTVRKMTACVSAAWLLAHLRQVLFCLDIAELPSLIHRSSKVLWCNVSCFEAHGGLLELYTCAPFKHFVVIWQDFEEKHYDHSPSSGSPQWRSQSQLCPLGSRR